MHCIVLPSFYLTRYYYTIKHIVFGFFMEPLWFPGSSPLFLLVVSTSRSSASRTLPSVTSNLYLCMVKCLCHLDCWWSSFSSQSLLLHDCITINLLHFYSISVALFTGMLWTRCDLSQCLIWSCFLVTIRSCPWPPTSWWAEVLSWWLPCVRTLGT